MEALLLTMKIQTGTAHTSLDIFGLSNSSTASTLQSQVKNHLKPSVFSAQKGGRQTHAKGKIRPSLSAVAPMQPSSWEGRFLRSLLQSRRRRHLFQFAVSELLNEMVSTIDEEAAHKKQSSSSLLHRRISEVKEKERQTGVEDVIYMSIVHKFCEVEVPMVTTLSECTNDNGLDIHPSMCRELEFIHSLEVQEMMKEHIDSTQRKIGKSTAINGTTTCKIDRPHLGRIYAASIQYGYFLKSASLRRQMDLRLLYTQNVISDTQVTLSCKELERCNRLSTYVRGFDAESLHRCAQLKSKEADNVIEKHTRALFADENFCQLKGTENKLIVTFRSLERLVVEAISFGSFLWDVEIWVDCVYPLNGN